MVPYRVDAEHEVIKRFAKDAVLVTLGLLGVTGSLLIFAAGVMYLAMTILPLLKGAT